MLRLEADAQTLTRTDAVLSDTALIIVFHPECVFSRRAFAALNAAPNLANVLQSHTLWLRPVDGDLNVEKWNEWNRTSLLAPLVVAYAEAEWPWIDYWGMPTFYVLRDGKVQTRLTGWPGDERLDELTNALRVAGLLAE